MAADAALLKAFEFEFIVPPKQGLKLESVAFHEVAEIMFEFIVPPKQGLKLIARYGYLYRQNSLNL